MLSVNRGMSGVDGPVRTDGGAGVGTFLVDAIKTLLLPKGVKLGFRESLEVDMFGLGATEMMIILVLVLIIFGAGKLPEIGSALGKGLRSFKKSVRDRDEIDITPKDEDEKDK